LADLVNNIAGMNCFNTLVIAAADLGYHGGSIYQDVSPLQVVWGLVAILMAAILLLDMVLRETHAIGNISF
jgi:cation:H+ antiporter